MLLQSNQFERERPINTWGSPRQDPPSTAGNGTSIGFIPFQGGRTGGKFIMKRGYSAIRRGFQRTEKEDRVPL